MFLAVHVRARSRQSDATAHALLHAGSKVRVRGADTRSRAARVAAEAHCDAMLL